MPKRVDAAEAARKAALASHIAAKLQMEMKRTKVVGCLNNPEHLNMLYDLAMGFEGEVVSDKIRRQMFECSSVHVVPVSFRGSSSAPVL